MGLQSLLEGKEGLIIEALGLQQAIIFFSSYHNSKAAAGRIAASAVSLAASALQGNKSAKDAAKGAAEALYGPQNGVLRVQYNPKSLKFNAALPNAGLQNKSADSDAKNSPAPGNVSMSVELVFVQTGTGDTGVKDRMNLLLDVMLYDTGKEICFFWANMYIKGSLSSFEGVYDMFDASGRPMSGRIILGISVSGGINYLQGLLGLG